MATSKKRKDKFKGMKEEDLKKERATLDESLRAIRFKAEGAKSKNVKEASVLKKQIARVMTEINRTENSNK